MKFMHCDLNIVMATDCSEFAPALYDADKHFIVPIMHEEGYLDVILLICKENNIKAVLSLIDPELSLLAAHKQDFLDIGATPIISDWEIVEMCFNKYRMHNFLNEKGFEIPKTYINKELFFKDLEAGLNDFPAFVKPIKVDTSNNIN